MEMIITYFDFDFVDHDDGDVDNNDDVRADGVHGVDDGCDKRKTMMVKMKSSSKLTQNLKYKAMRPSY